MDKSTSNKREFKPERFLWLVTILLLLFLGVSFFTAFYVFWKFKPLSSFLPSKEPYLVKEFKKFASEQEFKEFLEKASEEEVFLPGRGFSLESEGLDKANLQAPAPVAERVSETNVQVKGIDEPDIVKTDGRQIYFSSDRPIIRSLPARPESPLTPLMEESVESRVVPSRDLETKIIKAFPPSDLQKTGEIEKIGNLLLNNEILVIFSSDKKIFGFDVSNPLSPVEKWSLELKSNTSLVAARLYNNNIYFITQGVINRARPCPIVPLSSEKGEISVECTDIYYPGVDLSVNVTFTAFIVDPATGEIKKDVSFVGSSGQSIIYMSSSGLYVAYNYTENMVDFFYKFFLQEKDLVSQETIERLKKIRDYDLSNQAKMVEYRQILEEYKASLDDDERLRIENEINNRMKDYGQSHMRELQKTAIVKLALSDFSIEAIGEIAGRPLNQFSLDEYEGNLRVASTVGGWIFGLQTEEANDVYILDEDLEILGSLSDLGLDERIYSVRFVEDKGYLVTFKQIDPFFVLDLSNPADPEVKGELKIPGYSSYLHPLEESLILGIGKEDSQVKLSLFDVKRADEPLEKDKYLLDEYWSDVLNTHHAFLADSKHKVFFLPGSKGGYIFSYKGNSLKLEKAVSNIQARRAIYLDNYIYLIGDDKIVVLDENDWKEVNSFDF